MAGPDRRDPRRRARARGCGPRRPRCSIRCAGGRWCCGRCSPRRRPAPRRSSSSTARGARSRTRCPTGVDVAVQEQQHGTGDAVKAARRPHRRRPGRGPDGRRPADHRRGDRRPRAARTTRRRDDADDGARRPRQPTGASCATATAASRRGRDQGRGDATPEQLAIKEVNTGIYCFDGRRADGRARRRSAPTTPRASTTCPTCCATACRASRPRRRRPHAHARRQRPRRPRRRPRRSPSERIHRAPHARRRDDRRPGRRPSIDADVTIGQDTRIEPRHDDQARDARSARTCTIRCSYLDQATVDDGVSVGPFAYLRPGAHLKRGAKAGTFVEIKNSRDRRGHQGPAPVLHRRRRRRGGRRTSAPPRSPPTTTAATSTARRSATACARASTRRWSPRSRSATAPTTAAGSVITEDVAGQGARRSRARARRTSRATPTARRGD